jgi:hypothetical protein
MEACGRLHASASLLGDKISRYYPFSRRKVWYQSRSQPRILVIQPVAGHLSVSVIPTLLINTRNMQEASHSVTEHAKEMWTGKFHFLALITHAECTPVAMHVISFPLLLLLLLFLLCVFLLALASLTSGGRSLDRHSLLADYKPRSLVFSFSSTAFL